MFERKTEIDTMVCTNIKTYFEMFTGCIHLFILHNLSLFYVSFFT